MKRRSWPRRVSRTALPCLLALAAAAVQAQTAGTAAPAPAGNAQASFAAAEAAYRAFEQKNYELAAEQARTATRLAPANVDYARLLMYSLSAAGKQREAVDAASAVLALAPTDAQALAERGRLRMALGDAAGGRQDLQQALDSPGLEPAQRIGLLADLGRMAEARREYLALDQGRAGAGAAAAKQPDEMERAYLAGRLGLTAEAVAAFRQADAAGKLPPSALRDAGFAAVRAGRNEEAQAYFRRAVDASRSGTQPLAPQTLFETRRSIAELSRHWGVFASLNYRGGGGVTPGFGAVGAPVDEAWQAGAEAWWRPFGQHNGRYAEVFARGFQTLESSTGASGSDTRQLGVGARVKPFTQQNLVLSLSRTDSRLSGHDWLVQAGYSNDWGGDIRQDATSWWTSRLAAEIGRYVRRDQNYATASLLAGRTYKLNASENATLLYPHLVVAAEYDTAAAKNHAVGIGPGFGVRQWFRHDTYNAARSYLDVTLQYRAHVSGDQRARGWYLTTLLAY
jgi:hypothetical protein